MHSYDYIYMKPKQIIVVNNTGFYAKEKVILTVKGGRGRNDDCHGHEGFGKTDVALFLDPGRDFKGVQFIMCSYVIK